MAIKLFTIWNLEQPVELPCAQRCRAYIGWGLGYGFQPSLGTSLPVSCLIALHYINSYLPSSAFTKLKLMFRKIGHYCLECKAASGTPLYSVMQSTEA